MTAAELVVVARLVVATELLERLELLLDDDELEGPAALLVVLAWLPGRHWEYHAFWKTQVLPEAQQVGPVQPLPPHWDLGALTSAKDVVSDQDWLLTKLNRSFGAPQ